MLPIFGLANVPMWLTPFASLIITSILIPKASFLGHLSGIIAGFIISSRIFDGLGPWGALGLLAAALTGAVVAGVASAARLAACNRVAEALPGLEPACPACTRGLRVTSKCCMPAGVAWVAASRNQLPYIQLPGSEADVEAAGGGQGQLRIVNGVIQRR